MTVRSVDRPTEVPRPPYKLWLQTASLLDVYRTVSVSFCTDSHSRGQGITRYLTWCLWHGFVFVGCTTQSPFIGFIALIHLPSSVLFSADSTLRTGFWWGRMRVRYHLEDLVIEGRIILKCISMKWNEEAWTGLIWMRIGTGGGLLWML